MAFGVLEKDAVVIGTTRIPMLLVGPNANPWFRGDNLAEYLGYSQPRVAVTKLTLRGGTIARRRALGWPMYICTSDPGVQYCTLGVARRVQ